MKQIPVFNASIISWNKDAGHVNESKLPRSYKNGFRLKSDRTGVVMTFQPVDVTDRVI